MDKMICRAAFAGLIAGISTASIAATAISQKDKTFSQESVAIRAGDKLSFVNDDNVTHDISVRTPGGASRPGIVEKPGDELELAFDDVGTYQVRCLIHPKMKMTVDAR
jgi:cytochrome c peroxidase